MSESPQPGDILDANRHNTADDDEGKQRVVQVSDEENIAERRSHQRIQAILDEIANVRMARAKDWEGVIRDDVHRKNYHQAVRALWTELSDHIANSDFEEYLWFEVPLGAFTIRPPSVFEEPETRSEAENRPDLLPGGTWATEEKRTVVGFDEFLTHDVVIRERFSVRFDDSTTSITDLQRLIKRDDPGRMIQLYPRTSKDFEEPFQADVIKLLPERIINNALSALKEFTRKQGLTVGDPDEIPEDSEVW